MDIDKKTNRTRFRNLILGMVSMLFFMAGDYLLDAAGAGDYEIGIAVHSNWDKMATWRFVASATIAAFAILLTYLGSQEAIAISKSVRTQTKTSRFMDFLFRMCHVILITYGAGFHIFLCALPIAYKEFLLFGGAKDVAIAGVNQTGLLVIIPLMILYLVCDIGVSVAWFYMVLSKKLKLPWFAVLCCPLSSIVIDFILKAIPLQFFKDFTVAFESLGWVLMFIALAVHVRKTEKV
ncbi:MAG: hypothetical protein IJ796_07620 [Lachnospiraceae bacterium]|nr:hypothetical protein [Lachnospiraceae bacterium]